MIDQILVSPQFKGHTSLSLRIGSPFGDIGSFHTALLLYKFAVQSENQLITERLRYQITVNKSFVSKQVSKFV